MSQEDVPEGYERVEFVYAGRRVDSKEKVNHEIRLMSNPDDDAAGRWYSKSPGVSVGTVFSMFQKVGTTEVQFASIRYVRPHVGLFVEVWRARDLAAEARLSQKALISKAKKVEPLEEILEPIRELSARLMPAERRALAVRILEVLR